MIEDVLPAAAVSFDVREDLPSSLFPDELAWLGRATEARRSEFATTRFCARKALEKLDIPPVAIATGPKGEPHWPPGVVGSLTHCTGFRAAAVARDTDLRAIGIDAEPDAALPPSMLAMVASHERAWIATASPAVHWDRVIFSAKESVYKAWFPLTRQWLDFADIHVTFEPDRALLHARLLLSSQRMDNLPATTLSGRYAVRDGLILTCVALECPNRA